MAQQNHRWWGVRQARAKRFHPKEYQAWYNMMERCYDLTHWNYPHYGGRGITVCERWHSPENFFADMGPAPGPKHSLDRYPNNDGNYEPSNCRWATAGEQLRNRRNTLLVPWEGKMIPAVDLAVILGKDPIKFTQFVWQRIYRSGYTPEEAVADLADGRSGRRRRNNSTLIRINGGPVISLQEAAAQLSLNYDTVNYRRYRNPSYTIADCLGLSQDQVEVIQEVRRPRRKKGSPASPT